MFIYLIVNHITGKYYVGQHKGDDLQHYLQQKFYEAERHLKGRSYLYHSIRKHGREAFTIHALLSDIQTRPELDAYERDFIAFLRSQDSEYGYNICRGGEGFTGPHTEETKRKNTENSLATWQDPVIRARRVKNQKQVRDARGGSFLTAESVTKIKAARAVQDETPRIAGCQKYAEEHKEEMSTRLSHEAHVLGGKAGSREAKQRAARISVQNGSYAKAQHQRWHVNRGRTNSFCAFCRPSAD
jgi:hypothetical protein